MLPLNERIADRIARGRQNAIDAAPDGKPSEADIYAVTDHTQAPAAIDPVNAKGKPFPDPAAADNGDGWSDKVDPKAK